MDWPSVFAGAGAAAALIGTALIPLLRLRDERRSSLRAEAREERERRIRAEDDAEAAHDSLGDSEASLQSAEATLESYRVTVEKLRGENQRFRAALAVHGILERALHNEALDPSIVAVFDFSRDLWLVTTPEDGGTVLLALGPWHRLGIDASALKGSGWRSFVAPASRAKADQAEASALASGGRAALWYRGKTAGGRDGEFCLLWRFGRYNGETLAVARVIAFRSL